MATAVTEKLSQLFTNVRQLPQLLGPPSPGTVSSAEVPPVFWKPYIHGGYRPLRRPWRYYFSTLFQQHNEAVNVWSHLAAALALLLRLQRLWQRVDFGQDAHARPLLLILAASITYLSLSSLAHLLQAKSEFWHYGFFFLDYVGVAVYQYGSALGHFYYAIEPGWHRRVRGFFLPLAAALAWLSCAGSCYAKFRFHPRCPLPGRLCQELPSGLAYALDISPVLHRICTAARPDPALLYHRCQVLFFLLGAFFFSHPYPEKWFPGKCHFLGQSHQIFHVFLVLCTLAQIEAVVLDYESRREIYSSLQGSPAHDFSALFLLTVTCSVLTATYMAHRVKNKLGHFRPLLQGAAQSCPCSARALSLKAGKGGRGWCHGEPRHRVRAGNRRVRISRCGSGGKAGPLQHHRPTPLLPPQPHKPTPPVPLPPL